MPVFIVGGTYKVFRGNRQGKHIVTAAVGGYAARTGKSHHAAFGQSFQSAFTKRCIGNYYNHTGAVRIKTRIALFSSWLPRERRLLQYATLGIQLIFIGKMPQTFSYIDPVNCKTPKIRLYQYAYCISSQAFGKDGWMCQCTLNPKHTVLCQLTIPS